MDIREKCQCARVERPSTGSWMTIECASFQQEPWRWRHHGGASFSQWETIVSNYFPKWELVTCGDDID